MKNTAQADCQFHLKAKLFFASYALRAKDYKK